MFDNDILAKPIIPLDVKASVVTSETMTVRWTPGFIGETPQTFAMQFKISSQSDENYVKVKSEITSARSTPPGTKVNGVK